MLSAFKNFFITFLVAALVFGAAGYFATRFLTDTITDIFDAESSELNSILSPSDSTGATDTDPSADTSVPPDTPDKPEVLGESFNMLFIVTDYQPDIFSDYYPTAEMLDSMQASLGSEATDVLGAAYRRPRAVATVLLRADKERHQFTYTVFPAITRITTSSGPQTLGDLYSLYGMDYMIDTVSGITGITIDHHFVINVTELHDLVSEIGGFPLYFTNELYFNGMVATSKKPSEDNPDAFSRLYSIGNNTVDGSGAIALMMWEDFSSSSAMSERSTVLVNVLKSIHQKLAALPEAEFTALYERICETIPLQTTFTAKDLVAQIELVRAINDERFTVKVINYPGQYIGATETAGAYFEPSINDGIALFKNYRKIFEEN